MNKKTGEGIKRRDFLAFTLSMAAIGISKVALSGVGTAAASKGKVKTLGIYPPLGMSRVGNSQDPDGWFYAPEVPGLAPNSGKPYKDKDGKLKKQVQRFRIYGFDKKGVPVREFKLTDPDVASIIWTVHVANSKAAWYGFKNPLDLGENAPGIPNKRRNEHVRSKERHMLIINPGEVSIQGAADQPIPLEGRFWGAFKDSAPTGNHETLTVKLGELRTDGEGRLLVFPADGISRSVLLAQRIDNFTDNDAWYDDWCDGWVKAEVKMQKGKTWGKDEVENAWVACCGPDFSPEIPPIISIYDAIYDVQVEAGMITPPDQVSFRRDVYPFFQRLGLMVWVANAANLRRGWIDVGNFNDPDYIAKLADASDDNKAFRTKLFKKIRGPKDNFKFDCENFHEKPGTKGQQELKLPYILGGGVDYTGSPDHWFKIPTYTHEVLKKWAKGDFVNDLEDEKTDAVTSLKDVDLNLQPESLTRAALSPLSGSGFHPGVELPWVLAQLPSLGVEPFYRGLFRINPDTNSDRRPGLVQDLGRLLTPELAFCGNGKVPGVVGAQMPGDLTRWMGLPWQPDAFSCQDVYYATDFPTSVWWPALLPVDVLPHAYYKALMNPNLPVDERLKFYHNRRSWSRGGAGIGYHVEGSYTDGLNRMVEAVGHMGFVVKMPGPEPPEEIRSLTEGKASDEEQRLLRCFWIPRELYVEMERGSVDLKYNQAPRFNEPDQ